MTTNPLDVDAAWPLIHRAAAEVMRTEEVFWSTHREAEYLIQDVQPTRIVIERLRGKPETLRLGEVRLATIKLNAGGGRVHRRKLMYTVAKEAAYVRLHPALGWSADHNWIEVKGRDRTASAFTQYWQNDTWDAARGDGDRLHYVGGNEFRKRGVEPGDFVYVVTNQQGKMYVAARMVVEKITDAAEARRLLKTDDLWPADEHVIGRDGTLKRFDIRVPDDDARRLRFGSDELPLVFARPDVLDQQTLRGVRRLSSESASILNNLLAQGVEDDYTDLGGEDYLAFEGTAYYAEHRRHERDPRLVRLKKAHVMRAQGKLSCEVCDFDFAEHFGELGQGVIDCHHNKPIAKLKRGEPTRVASPWWEGTTSECAHRPPLIR
jgi:hypothetical protein